MPMASRGPWHLPMCAMWWRERCWRWESDNAIGESFNIVGPVPVSYTMAARLIADNSERVYRDVKIAILLGTACLE